MSLIKNYGIKPDIKGWFEDLAKRVNITEAIFFADFSHKSLADEIKRIRPYSNKIIDTRNPLGVQKDFTDFIILDNIYQKALLSDDVDCFVLFSGDGHFSSVTSFLKNIYGKQVGVYAINGSFSHQLRETSSWSVILPTENMLLRLLLRLALLPVVVSISYEFNRLVGRHDNWLTHILTAPGMWMQRFTTNEPDDSMIEVAIEALTMVIPTQEGADRW